MVSLARSIVFCLQSEIMLYVCDVIITWSLEFRDVIITWSLEFRVAQWLCVFLEFNE